MILIGILKNILRCFVVLKVRGITIFISVIIFLSYFIVYKHEIDKIRCTLENNALFKKVLLLITEINIYTWKTLCDDVLKIAKVHYSAL